MDCGDFLLLPCYLLLTSGGFTSNNASLNLRSGGLVSAAGMKDENMNFNSPANRERERLPITRSLLRNAANASSPLRERSGTLASAAIVILSLLAFVKGHSRGPGIMTVLGLTRAWTGAQKCFEEGVKRFVISF